MDRIFVLICFLFCGCDYEGYWNGYMNITDYDINLDAVTPRGIYVDTSGFEIDLEEIDRQVDFLENCLQENSIISQIHREWFVVKIAPDWFVSECSGQQIFPCEMPDSVCENKDLEITEECPCMCRSAIQDENTVVTTPNFYLFRGELARMATGYNNPWFYPVSGCLLDR